MKLKKTRILFTISNFNTAGSGKVVYDLAKGLDPNVFEVEIACGSREGAFFKVVETLGLPIHIFETKTSYRPYQTLLFRIWKISKFYKKHNFDVIHSWQWSSDWTEALAARLVGVKWVYTKKAMGFNNRHWHIKSYLAHFIITINEEMRGYFPNKKAQALIPLGIDTNYYKTDAVPKRSEVNSKKFNIITVANLVPVKGIQVLIEALHKLKDQNVTLAILGDCDTDYGRAMIELSSHLGMQEQIRFYGKQLDVRPYLSAADLYVIPTLDEGRREGMPMALVEAMSMGIPVLGSDITGINYVLKDFKNLLYSAGDIDELVLKIKGFQAMDREERLALGKELRLYCNTNFAMHSFITAHENLYKSLLKNE
ncbi:glycosyltransferase involved in cell wall biosynthesis [Gelidibacter sediminis]|uniref:Glycosyltransferase involved in cell wall biosynthesis n=1 Tax=Gelidibacter sediminis TaxID=1608710 RepID=A0A4R7PJD1_9FLAO|nr:glycosyltransferase family 4 protein [Gelidibacter sediminis]TDU34414.1 glycosyltransferase involved in cell wall biosynthesis [Gelidibacter sediminis]